MVSDVWQFCTRLANNRVRCDQCGRIMSYHGTTNLRVHVGRHYGLTPQLCKFSRSKGSIKLPQHGHLKPPQEIYTPITEVPRQSPAPAACVRWTGYSTNMQAMFPKLLLGQHFVDVTVACDGQNLKCHKVVLAACSPYFADMLSGNPCQHPIVIIKGIKFWELQACIDFMYHGEVNIPQDKLNQLLAAAEVLQIRGLAGPFAPLVRHSADVPGSSRDVVVAPSPYYSFDDAEVERNSNKSPVVVIPLDDTMEASDSRDASLDVVINEPIPRTSKRARKKRVHPSKRTKSTLAMAEKPELPLLNPSKPETWANEQANQPSTSKGRERKPPPLKPNKRKCTQKSPQKPLEELTQDIKLEPVEPVDPEFGEDSSNYESFETASFCDLTQAYDTDES